MPSVKSIAQLDLNLLKVLEALYQHENMTIAAEHLNITPSAVSHAIKRLREVLEDPLFVRHGTQMLPTPGCRRIMPQLLETLGNLRKSLQSLNEFEPTSVSQTIRLAIHDALEPLFFPLILAEFARAAPMLSFQSIKLDRDLLPSQLGSGQVDFAIDVGRPLSTPIQHVCIAKSPFSLLVSKAHIVGSKMTTAQYGKSSHITVSNRPTGKVLEDLAFAQLGFNREIKVRCQSYQTAVQIIKQRALILTLPESMAVQLQDNELKRLPLPFSVPAVETHLYWHNQSETDSLLGWVASLLQECLTSMQLN